MNVMNRYHEMVVCLLSCFLIGSAVSQAQETRFFFPNAAPGQSAAEGEERDTSGPDGRHVAGQPVIRTGHVSMPSITIYRPAKDKDTGAAVIVCPGGGYNILAYDLEGTEVCQWLNSIGVTGVLLKYRVPRVPGRDRPLEPLMDAQRAIAMVRSDAASLGIDPDRIGVLGFSAGGNLAARLCCNYQSRLYETVDNSDNASRRPDFAILIYPAYLIERDSEQGTAGDLPIDKDTPPMFMSMSFDDPVNPENILRMGVALKRAGVPCEVHMYPTGGHGYGLRRTESSATTWPDRAAEWLAASGWLKK